MSKQLKVLHTIFELEFAPPFQLKKYGTPFRFNNQDCYNYIIINKYPDTIGTYDYMTKYIIFERHIDRSLLTKIKRTFNIEKLSDSNVYYIAKHLFIWLQDKLPDDLEYKSINLRNNDSWNVVGYPRYQK